ncbi:MAG: radical SAM protein [candidate division KSB1 bacterium]|nr:radical SAM protein [candidate division KSB1 bacterium]MDZ7274286.1 radical SAM protein [candidate division KSB1 bacterium]MDZ7287192.1 radical SAM protein [candidate division KSB1 bacterium]MDZ7296883.1 radical SAM protein [candidate division KSB1 bacterium]MDZ7306012.1 radical SAM protein [candidate division KSB1 bacterium]
MTLEQKYRYLFGPVRSRRLGLSLGIDIVPGKTCTFNCVYCQLGRTTQQTVQREEYVPANEVLTELADFLQHDGRADYLTFSGSGEPTLHRRLGEMIGRAKRLSSIPVAVLTCSALMYDAQVRQELAQADVVLPSLDAASPRTFYAINRPHGRLYLAEIIHGLRQFRAEYSGKIWLEIMLVKGVNDGAEEIALLRRAIAEIRPDKVHLNTVVRPPAEDEAQPLSEEELRAVQAMIGPPAEVMAERPTAPRTSLDNHLISEAVNLIARHPMTLEEIAHYMNCKPEIIALMLKGLTETGEVEARTHRGRVFYIALTAEKARSRRMPAGGAKLAGENLGSQLHQG